MQTSGKNNTLEHELFALRDAKYATFSAKLIPNIDPKSIIGVRAPCLKRIAKEMGADDSFLLQLPHRWHEENMLHAYILCSVDDFDSALALTERFLPFVSNWAVCDSLLPKAFARHAEKLLEPANQTRSKPHASCLASWLHTDHEYSVRFGISMLMRLSLDNRFNPKYLQWVADIKRDEYYVRMMQAWFFATALAKQWDASIPFLQVGCLDEWVRRKSLQKALESFRISSDQKNFLRTLR